MIRKYQLLLMIIKWITPYNLYVYIFNFNSRIKRKTNLIDNSDLFVKLRKNDTKIYIFGNGPSLNMVNFARLKRGLDMFVCNEFNQHKEFYKILIENKLTYFMGDNLKSFINYNEELVGDIERMFELFIKGRTSNKYNTVMFFDIANEVKKRYPESQILGFNMSTIKEQIKKEFVRKGLSIDEKLIDEANNVRHTPHLMILVALAMGYEEIFLFGLDHSYVRDRFEGLLTQPHFYEVFDKTIEEIGDMSSRDLTELFLDSHLTFKLYKSQNELAKLLGVRIIDFTENGCLDMFEKRKLSSHDLGRND